MLDVEQVIREGIDRAHILDTFEDVPWKNHGPAYFECACGWRSTSEFVPNRHLEFEKHKDELVESYMVEAKGPQRKPLLPDPISTPTDVYIRALIMQKHQPSEFGCSCGAIMASGPARNDIFDFHIDSLLERVLAVVEKEIVGDCRG